MSQNSKLEREYEILSNEIDELNNQLNGDFNHDAPIHAIRRKLGKKLLKVGNSLFNIQSEKEKKDETN